MGTHSINLDRDCYALSNVMEFDCVIRVDEHGRVFDAADIYAPDVYTDTDGDGQILDLHEKAMIDSIRSQGWEPMNGYSGQDRYSGPIMHPSEFIGGRLAEDILGTPGFYVAVTVEMFDRSEDAAGWMVLRRDA